MRLAKVREVEDDLEAVDLVELVTQQDISLHERYLHDGCQCVNLGVIATWGRRVTGVRQWLGQHMTVCVLTIE